MAKETPTQQPEAEPIPVAEAVAKAVVTQEELRTEMEAAMKSGDWKLVSQVARKIDTMTKAAEKAELDTKRAELDKVIEVVKDAINSAVEPLTLNKELDAADGIWYSYDFGEQAPTVRLMKSTARAPRAGGGGTGKKFDVSTDALLAKYGAEPYKETGMTFQQAYESNTDKNFRYAIRQALLKKDGII